MSLKNLLKTRLTGKFINAKLEGTGSLSPRNGYYFIKEVNYRDIPEKGKFPIATVLWKISEEESFMKDVSFEISLSALSIGDPLDYINMVNNTILIYDVELVKVSEGSDISRITCKYETILQKPRFTTSNLLVVTSFMGNATTLSEAHRNFEKELGIDLSEAIEFEGNLSESFDGSNDDESIK